MCEAYGGRMETELYNGRTVWHLRELWFRAKTEKGLKIQAGDEKKWLTPQEILTTELEGIRAVAMAVAPRWIACSISPRVDDYTEFLTFAKNSKGDALLRILVFAPTELSGHYVNGERTACWVGSGREEPTHYMPLPAMPVLER